MAAADKVRFQNEASNMSQMQEETAPKRRKRDPNAPKHPVSAYLFFVAESRTKLCKEYPGMSFGEMAKFIGSKWKGLTPDERKVRATVVWRLGILIAPPEIYRSGCQGQGEI
jgi:hypothetical protein